MGPSRHPTRQPLLPPRACVLHHPHQASDLPSLRTALASSSAQGRAPSAGQISAHPAQIAVGRPQRRQYHAHHRLRFCSQLRVTSGFSTAQSSENALPNGRGNAAGAPMSRLGGRRPTLAGPLLREVCLQSLTDGRRQRPGGYRQNLAMIQRRSLSGEHSIGRRASCNMYSARQIDRWTLIRWRSWLQVRGSCRKRRNAVQPF